MAWLQLLQYISKKTYTSSFFFKLIKLQYEKSDYKKEYAAQITHKLAVRTKSISQFTNFSEILSLKLNYFHPSNIHSQNTQNLLLCDVKPLDSMESSIISEYKDKLHTYTPNFSSLKKKATTIRIKRIEDIYLTSNYVLLKNNKLNTTSSKYTIVQPHTQHTIIDPYSSGYGTIRNIWSNSQITLKTNFPSSTPINSIDWAIMFSEKVSTNYYHWFFESICKIKAIESTKSLAGIPIIIDAKMPFQHYQLLQLALDDITQNNLLLFQSNSDILHFQNLFIVDIPNIVFDNFDMLPTERIAYSKDHLLFIVNRVLSRVQLENKPYPKKIYLSRGKNRSLVNKKVVESLLISQGFTIINPEKYSLHEQIGFFQNADIIVSASGAALTNIVFCKKGTTIITLTSEFLEDDCIFSSLAGIFELKYSVVCGIEAYKMSSLLALYRIERYKKLYNIDSFIIDPNKLKQAIENPHIKMHN
jgi:hypothetical protein